MSDTYFLWAYPKINQVSREDKSLVKPTRGRNI